MTPYSPEMMGLAHRKQELALTRGIPAEISQSAGHPRTSEKKMEEL